MNRTMMKAPPDERQLVALDPVPDSFPVPPGGDAALGAVVADVRSRLVEADGETAVTGKDRRLRRRIVDVDG